jgi:hypothetical protein
MKTNTNTKSVHFAGSPVSPRPGGIRPAIARALERRYERRKIREQLRRLDWALNTEDDLVF